MPENIRMWEYWRDKRGSPAEALLSDYPKLAASDHIFKIALGTIEIAERAIESRMKELIDKENS